MENLEFQKSAEDTRSNTEMKETQEQTKENFAKEVCVPPSYCGDKNFWYPDATPGCSFWPSPPRPNYEVTQNQTEASEQIPKLQTPLEESNESHNNDDTKNQLKQTVERSPAEQALFDSWMDEYIMAGFREEIAMLSAELAGIDEDSDDDIYYGDTEDQNQK